MIACALTSWLSSAFILDWIGGVLTDAFLLHSGHPWRAGLIPAGVWLVSPLVVLRWPRLELWINRQLLVLREPDASERVRLENLLRSIASRAGALRHLDYFIAATPQVNALAAGRSMLAVTERALALDDEHLEAILAHEVGHLAHRHPIALALAAWYSLPLDAFERLMTALTAGSGPIHRTGRAFVDLFRSILGLPAFVGLNTMMFLLRRAELEADAWACELGYGGPLATVLGSAAAGEPVAAPTRVGWLPISVKTHPPIVKRIASLLT